MILNLRAKTHIELNEPSQANPHLYVAIVNGLLPKVFDLITCAFLLTARYRENY